jgi:hypothetical protein
MQRPSPVRQVLDEKETMVFKRALDVNYHLKLKASRALFSEINTRSAHRATNADQLFLVLNKTAWLARATSAGVEVSRPFPLLLRMLCIWYVQARVQSAVYVLWDM